MIITHKVKALLLETNLNLFSRLCKALNDASLNYVLIQVPQVNPANPEQAYRE